MKLIFPLVLMIVYINISMAQYTPLYSQIPNYIDSTNKEYNINIDGISRIQKVSIPAYKYYRVKQDLINRPCVIICPGGGYSFLAADHEGTAVASFFNSIGINALLLKYRIPNSRNQLNKSIAPLQDAQQAIRLTRLHAAEWGIDPNKIGIMGFSAGGHLASSLATHFADVKIDNPENISLRPNFHILIYPVISFRTFGHKGSIDNLIGKDANEELVHYFSNEEQVNLSTPPAFIVHAIDDQTVSVKNAIVYQEALEKNKIANYLYLFEKGEHGFGMENKLSQVQWPPMLIDWLKSMHYISK